MSIKIEQMSLNNIRDVYNFEVNNKEFFEKTLLPRPKGYFNYESFKGVMEEILSEQVERKCSMYLIRDNEGSMIGRVNLSTITDDKAEIGYRMAEGVHGKGYATQAVRLAMNIGFDEYGVKLIEAGTATTNIGSQRVLEKNGFMKVGYEEKVVKVNGIWIDGYLYVKER